MHFVEVGSESVLYEIARGLPSSLNISAEQFGIHEFEGWWEHPREVARMISFQDRDGRPCVYALDGHGTLSIQEGFEPSEDGLALWEAAQDQLGGKIREAMARQGYTFRQS